MTAVIIKDGDLEHAKYSNHLDDMDMVYSPNGGHIVCVAVKNGVRVCWQCGEPFMQGDPKLGEIEKLTDRQATVPIYLHRRCVNGPHKRTFAMVTAGLRTRRAVADIVKKTKSLITG